MPSGRLTYPERQRVAAGLADGLSYAEIGRRLGRSKSTVVREVARNGGAHDYRADRAERAARHRARRRAPVAPAPPPRAAADPRTRSDFEERFAQMAAQTGMPSMMARVLICLFTAESGSRTATELAARLRVSPASVSKAVAWLEERGMLRRRRDGRRERYLIDDDVWQRAWLASMEGMAQWAGFTRQGAALFGGDTLVGARLLATSRWLQHIRQDMIEAAEHWRRASR
ncbi:helix-turn-helix domain-containing protein [Amycolatopsis sp. VS8301801F10]|uniref:helix-turn-helix domain-containing protein n=1 Tax=Amycolatopsis sp. VS8301801F10 TaxID=2652442 RepID=UPI0038FC26C8